MRDTSRGQHRRARDVSAAGGGLWRLTPPGRGPSWRSPTGGGPATGALLSVQGPPERLTGARQAGHDGSDGNAHRLGHLLVREALELAQHEQLSRTVGQVPEGPGDQRGAVRSKQQRFGIRLRPRAPVLLLVERVSGRREAAAVPTTADVADDPQEPGAGVAAAERPEVSQGPKRSLLHDVFRVVLVPQERARQAIGGETMRQDDLVEAFPDGGGQRRWAHDVIHSALRTPAPPGHAPRWVGRAASHDARTTLVRLPYGRGA